MKTANLITGIAFSAVFILFSSCDNSTEKDPEGGLPDNADSLNIDDSANSKTKSNLSLAELILLKRFNFRKHDKEFVYQNISTSDSLKDVEELQIKPLNKNEFFEAFQDSADLLYEPKTDGAYYISNQGEWKGYKKYIFAKTDETCCIWYYFNVYNKAGKKLSSEVFSALGEQSGWSIDVKSKMLNDSSFVQTSVECKSGFEEEFEKVECDSVVTVFTLNKNGEIIGSISSKEVLKSLNYK